MNAYPFTHDISGTIHLLFNDASLFFVLARLNVILRKSAGHLEKVGWGGARLRVW
jgi:hypothetical protein